MRTFGTDLGKKKIKGANNKIKAICMMSYLFGSILCLSLQIKVDMGIVLQYLLTPIPLALGHLDEKNDENLKSKFDEVFRK